jgi:predicted O-methyltransferase YrrM
MSLRWEGNVCFVGDLRLRFITEGYDREVTTDEEVILLKGPWHFGLYDGIVSNPSSIKNILEFGIFEGGSAFLFAEMFPNAKIVGIDMRASNPALERHIARSGLQDRIKLYHGVLQDDHIAVSHIINQEFGEAAIDMLVDDCSHNYSFSRSSFEIAFPKLKKSGIYALEDWDWAHHRLNPYKSWKSPVLSNFVFELTSALTSSPSLVTVAQIFRGLAVFTKGDHTGPVSLQELVHADREWPKV